MKISRSAFVKAAAVAGVALAALGTTTTAQARSDVYFSIGANVAPGVTLGFSNAPYYSRPVYVQPAPVYYQPAPVYYQPEPIYYQPEPVYYEPSYYQPQTFYYAPPVVTYVRRPFHHQHRHRHHYRY